MCKSPPVRGAWIESDSLKEKIQNNLMSPPVRGAWIESMEEKSTFDISIVASREGGVD